MAETIRLTARQITIKDYIDLAVEHYGAEPTLKEIGDRFGLTPGDAYHDSKVIDSWRRAERKKNIIS